MAIPNWGMLQKSQSDAETIEEAIVRLIDEHNADETSHLDTGESLQSHKAAEIIDHLAESIVYDKLALGSVDQRKMLLDNFFLFTAFESLDGWQLTLDSGCTAVAKILGARIDLANVNCRSVKMEALRPFGSSLVNFDKYPFFQTSLSVSDPTNVSFYFGVGEYSFMDPAAQFFGFYHNAGVLYSTMIVDGSPDDEVIADIDINHVNVYRADYNPDTDTLNWYVNGNLVRSVSVGMPAGISQPVFTYWFRTDENAIKQMTILDLLFQQKR